MLELLLAETRRVRVYVIRVYAIIGLRQWCERSVISPTLLKAVLNVFFLCII